MPLLIQIPVFFGLFSMLRSAVELRGAPWLGWIYDLSLTFHEVHGLPAFGYFLLPVVMGATQVYQQQPQQYYNQGNGTYYQPQPRQVYQPRGYYYQN